MSLGLALLGLPLLLLPHLVTVLAGIVLIAAGTFFAQAVATGFVGQAATSDRGAASGLYLAAYFAGGARGARHSVRPLGLAGMRGRDRRRPGGGLCAGCGLNDGPPREPWFTTPKS